MDKSSAITISLLSLLSVVKWTDSVDLEASSYSHTGIKDTRKLFGGYRITPRYCQPTRELSQELKGPNICMFNHECIQRNGIVVGACMDGFLFGACCQLPAGTAGELLMQSAFHQAQPSNTVYHIKPSTTINHNNQNFQGDDITSSGFHKITQSLLYGNQPLSNGVLPTAADNTVVQINGQDVFVSGGVTHQQFPDTDTVVVTAGANEINGDQFENPDVIEDRRTTHGLDLTTQPYTPDVSPYIHISISNAPSWYTPAPIIGGMNGNGGESIGSKPVFKPKPKPGNDEYVLVPTINNPQTRNKTESFDTIINIVQLVNETRKPTNPSVYSYSTATTKKPATTYGTTLTSSTLGKTTITTLAPRRTTSKVKLTTKKRLGTTTKKKVTTPTTTWGTTTPTITTTSINTKKPTYQYVSSTTFRPGYTSKKPPSTSYIYSSTISKRPGSGSVTTTVPGYAVTRPPNAPTIIVLGSTLANTSPEPVAHSPSSNSYSPTKYTTLKPNTYTASTSTKHPVTVTINNHILQHIYNTSERPSPTVLITPKPSITTPTPTINTYSAEDATTNGDNLINFPPVRNPNLNMSIPVFDQDNDITTPDFIEDDALNTKVESFVNKIIAGLQEPFDGLKDIVYAGVNKTETTTKKPVKKTTTKSSTRKPTTRVPATTPVTTTEKIRTTTKKVKTTKPTEKKKITTTIQTTESFIEHDDVSQDYRQQCGIRPLMKSGRIVGGKGATFGEFPWQVLVRESTWLGLFTKNKCGGVLISNKYVMTAAHCQPGFLASLVAVFGEFDISGDLEQKKAISRNVKRVIVHRQYDAATFENDLALLELEHPIQFDAHIVPICLPRDHEDFTGRMATVTGWGRLKYGGGVPSVLQEVQVPIMENVVCQEMFRTAGHQKVILESFLCAGYANGQKDSCEGDSGGPLVLQRPDGRYQLAGTVSHGIKCAAPYLPGVYMRTTYYKPWIESITGVH